MRGLVRRRPGPEAFPDGVEVVEGDARDRAVLARVVQGCEVVALAVNYPFAQWDPGMRDATAKAIAASLWLPIPPRQRTRSVSSTVHAHAVTHHAVPSPVHAHAVAAQSAGVLLGGRGSTTGAHRRRRR